MLVREGEKVKEKVTKQLGKEGMGSTNACYWFPKGTWQWRRYLVKSRHKYKAISTKNRHGESVQGETVFKFPLINDQGRNKMVSTRISCYYENSEKFQHDGVNDSKRRSQESRKNLNFCEKLQLMKMGKFQWRETRRVREQYPHPHVN